ncbi:DUF1826 domain-containing protein [Pseudooceanicola sp.]|uniref:DUF1826 domain-containing protein n=1 Tax=Pseudooceanicola sp. TaxID=1914328 RepID=UPI0035175BE5
MTLHSSIAPGATAGVLIVRAPEEMAAIRSAGIGGVIWQRRPLAGFQSWIDGLAPDHLPRTRTILRPDAVRDAVEAACDIAGTPDGPQKDLLADDIAALADIFHALIGARWLRLRLEPVTTDACRRFHIDRVQARLVCTYRGTGTQYGLGDASEPEVIRTVPTGSPLILRGTLWPASPDPGLLHRSPPIAGSGETRLMLALDPVDDPEDEI